jgi:CRP-like cAMP-binding protein
MFRPLPMPAIDELALHLDRVDFAVGEDVVVQGGHGDRFYVIEKGEAEVIGDGRFIRTLRSGDGFGEIALLHDMLRTATVRARTPLRLYTLDRRHFLSAVTDYESSEREADALVLERLDTFGPRSEPTR